MNLAEAFERVAKGTILGATVEGHGKLLAWSEARRIIDYDYDNGIGGDHCHAVYVWTETQVMFVSEYDGATSVAQVPRNPVSCDPGFDGT